MDREVVQKLYNVIAITLLSVSVLVSTGWDMNKGLRM